MQKKRKLVKSVEQLTFISLLIAISVVIGIFCKTYLNFAAGLFRITFENFAVILSGILYGPIIGGLTGLIADIISYLLSGQVYPPNIIVSVGATAIGVISGLVSKYMIRKRGSLQIVVSAGLSHFVGSLIIKTIGLFSYYGWAVLWRIPLYSFLIIPFEILLLCLLFKHGEVKKIINKIDKENKK